MDCSCFCPSQLTCKTVFFRPGSTVNLYSPVPVEMCNCIFRRRTLAQNHRQKCCQKSRQESGQKSGHADYVLKNPVVRCAKPIWIPSKGLYKTLNNVGQNALTVLQRHVFRCDRKIARIIYPKLSEHTLETCQKPPCSSSRISRACELSRQARDSWHPLLKYYLLWVLASFTKPPPICLLSVQPGALAWCGDPGRLVSIRFDIDLYKSF